MRIRALIWLLSLGVASGAAIATEAGTIEVFKSPSCGCCKSYIAYLRENGFKVSVTDVPFMDLIKAKYGVPEASQSCHTSVVNGYVIEGHVPVGALKKLLAEGKQIRGIAAPGMPANSPGMGEMKPGTVTIYEIPKAGETAKVFSVE